MTEIKICGITNGDDAACAADNGVNALGFIFYRESPRYVSPGDAAKIIRNLPSEVTTVGVFVNHDVRDVRGIAEACPLDMIQLHGDEPPEYAVALSDYPIIRAIAPQCGDDCAVLEAYPAGAVLVDAYHRRLYGGTGKEADWDVALLIKERHPLILSGGLHPGNLEDALRRVGPRAVDVNSGCEASPGKKDHDKIREITEIVRRFDEGSGTAGAGIFRESERRGQRGCPRKKPVFLT